MPDGLLLLAFALTLVVNAVLIGVAIRAMRPGGAFDDSRRGGAVGHAVARPTPPRPAAPAEIADSSLRGAEPLAHASAEPSGEVVAAPAIDAAPKRPSRQRGRSRPATTPTSQEPASPAGSPNRRAATKPGAANGRRRRFSLPPLDEDQDKVNRSIETFLSGGETTADGDTTQHGQPDHPPTTVALVAIVGAPPPDPDGGPGMADDAAAPVDAVQPVAADADAARRQAAVSTVKRALRAAARGTDRVETVGADRFRIVLAATGELAARAYLRRVRANVEPLLEELEPPRRLAVSTATILGEPVDRANEVAERRLQAAIDATHDATHDAGTDRRSEPRAAGD
ncbi:MAG TPA: hypothetical protein VIK65_09510 [Candidatus Limnocylindrales bacterium]|jgi:hypothetical protein